MLRSAREAVAGTVSALGQRLFPSDADAQPSSGPGFGAAEMVGSTTGTLPVHSNNAEKSREFGTASTGAAQQAAVAALFPAIIIGGPGSFPTVQQLESMLAQHRHLTKINVRTAKGQQMQHSNGGRGGGRGDKGGGWRGDSGMGMGKGKGWGKGSGKGRGGI